jgi:hypothetical protein
MLPTLIVLIACASAATAQVKLSPYEIVKRSVARDASNFDRYKDYTYHELMVAKNLDKNGTITKSESTLSEVMVLGGRPYERLLERNGKALSEKEARKEQEELDREAAKRAKETDRDRARYEKERKEERHFAQEVPDAFRFTMLGEEKMDGLPVWKIYADPNPDYRPRDGRAADYLKKVRGTIWIDQASYQWVRAELEVIDTISWGLFVLRIPPGAKISFVQTRVNNEVWLPQQIHIRGDAKVALLKTFRLELDLAYRDYRKFRTESQVIGVEEVSPRP